MRAEAKNRKRKTPSGRCSSESDKIRVIDCTSKRVKVQRCQTFVMQESRLSSEKRARLWHWILGHRNANVPVQMTRQGSAEGLDVTFCLNEDCVICDKAKFRQLGHPRRSLESRMSLPPYHTVYVDGFGGQSSFKVKSYSGVDIDPSYSGAVGGYVFVDAESDDISVKLYKHKSQFPDLLRSFLLSVMAIQYVVLES